jgi:DNA segregation ATPase FtsK/SpoIIIE, S-DNA-T family
MTAPAMPHGDLTVPPPPAMPAPAGSRWTRILIALPMLAGTVATALMFAGRQGGTYSYVVGGIFGVSSLGMLAASFAGAGRTRRVDIGRLRREYLRALTAAREEVRRTGEEQRAALEHRHPAATALWSMVSTSRVWERRAGDADFGVVRIGSGPQALATPLTPPVTNPADELEPVSATALRRFLDAYALVPDLPVAVTLSRFRRVRLRGPGARSLARAMIASVSFFSSPADIAVVVCAAPARRHHWEYVKWLPHARHPSRSDAAGPLRLFRETADELAGLLAGLSAKPIVIADGAEVPPNAIESACVIEVDATCGDTARDRSLTITIDDVGQMIIDGPSGVTQAGSADSMSAAEAEALARQLAPLRRSAHGASGPTAEPGFAALHGLTSTAALDPARIWDRLTDSTRLTAAIGSDPAGRPVVLDLKESALYGMGPHGLIIGATGSGKSELLRALVLSLATTHDSEKLNFVLVDFKGGATFASLDRLPHTAAVITNLAEELPLVDRMADALHGELVRRQELLRAAGNVPSVAQYDKLRASGADLRAIPTLLIVCDEFSELLSAKPEFIDLFTAMGRLGRSLGVHLLLASQRLDEGRLRGLETHLSYRIGLRTFSAIESRAVLGVADAYELPREPGHGYLRNGTEPLVRFKSAYVSGAELSAATPVSTTSLAPFRSEPVGHAPEAAAPSSDGGPSVLDIVVDRLERAGPPAHRIWLPPLGAADSLTDVIGTLAAHQDRGLTTVDRRAWGRLRAPVAVVDQPFEQRRDPLVVDLSGSAGHVAIVGGPQAGKSTLLRTLILGLALTHTPQEVTFYGLDFGGGGLSELDRLPHVGGVAGRHDADAVRRTVREAATVLAERERRVKSGAEAGPDLDLHGDMFLVVDGWSTLRSEYDDLEPLITDIATRGLSYRVHVIVTASRWADFRPALRDLLNTRLELRLGDPSESAVGRRLAVTVPERSPGRGLTGNGAHFLALRPDAGLLDAIASAWTDEPAPPVRELPLMVPLEVLDVVAASGLTIPIGIGESDLRPVSVDFCADPHLLVFGDSGCGKSSFLRALAASIARRYRPEEARIVVIDYRRAMLGEVTTEHLIGFASTSEAASPLLESVATYMRGRLPGPDVTPAQLKARSWWTGPECFVLVDDWDLIATGAANPVNQLLEFMPHARDVGLHLVIARRSGGAARAMYEPVLARLRELTTPGLIMSGNKDEGPLAGAARPQKLPPGRALFDHRTDGVRLVQLGYLEPVT